MADFDVMPTSLGNVRRWYQPDLRPKSGPKPLSTDNRLLLSTRCEGSRDGRLAPGVAAGSERERAAGVKAGNKGFEAAIAAIEMVSIQKKLGAQ